MAQFLYGASVQGIQNFIFQTNKLKEIIGASELVEQFCTRQFWETISPLPWKKDNLINDEACIIAAAGNIKYLFTSEDLCKATVLEFPRKIQELAPGIQISQAVVKIDHELKVEHLNLLERKLKQQRILPTAPVESAFMITERSRRTGLPAIKNSQNEDRLDKATLVKQEAAEKSAKYVLASKLFPEELNLSAHAAQYNTNDLPGNSEKNYIAVIHADGNNLGKIIQQLGDNLTGKERSSRIKKAYKNFSLAIESTTIEAAKDAFGKAYGNTLSVDKLPIRPVILGGDDLTIICNASGALPFMEQYLKSFELRSEANIKKYLLDEGFNLNLKRLTACAGISFVKASYPFHYAIDLAEELCSDAKQVSKQIALNNQQEEVPSSLSFFKVESSYHTSFAELKSTILKAGRTNLYYGPYGINSNSQLPSVNNLISMATKLKQSGAPASQLRRWLSALKSEGQAKLLMDRTIEVLLQKNKSRFIQELNLYEPINIGNKTHIYDIVALAPLLNTENHG